jgi:spore maturation protein CgeB
VQLVFFWDVDAPATIARLKANPDDSLLRAIPRYDAIFTYGGGPEIRDEYKGFGARAYYSIYNGLDDETHHPVQPSSDFMCDIAFLGNRLPDREARAEELFLKAAELAPDKKFVLGGEGWAGKPLPANVRWVGHVPTGRHNQFNCSADVVMNINRSSMASYGYSPPTRIFEVAGAGACLLCDEWPGIEDCFEPGSEILVVKTAQDVVNVLARYDCDARRRIGRAFRERALRDHTYAQRALQANKAFLECRNRRAIRAENASQEKSRMTGDYA